MAEPGQPLQEGATGDWVVLVVVLLLLLLLLCCVGVVYCVRGSLSRCFGRAGVQAMKQEKPEGVSQRPPPAVIPPPAPSSGSVVLAVPGDLPALEAEMPPTTGEAPPADAVAAGTAKLERAPRAGSMEDPATAADAAGIRPEPEVLGLLVWRDPEEGSTNRLHSAPSDLSAPNFNGPQLTFRSSTPFELSVPSHCNVLQSFELIVPQPPDEHEGRRLEEQSAVSDLSASNFNDPRLTFHSPTPSELSVPCHYNVMQPFEDIVPRPPDEHERRRLVEQSAASDLSAPNFNGPRLAFRSPTPSELPVPAHYTVMQPFGDIVPRPPDEHERRRLEEQSAASDLSASNFNGPRLTFRSPTPSELSIPAHYNVMQPFEDIVPQPPDEHERRRLEEQSAASDLSAPNFNGPRLTFRSPTPSELSVPSHYNVMQGFELIVPQAPDEHERRRLAPM